MVLKIMFLLKTVVEFFEEIMKLAMVGNRDAHGRV